MKNLEHKEVPMDLEEMMIDYVLNRATQPANKKSRLK